MSINRFDVEPGFGPPQPEKLSTVGELNNTGNEVSNQGGSFNRGAGPTSSTAPHFLIYILNKLPLRDPPRLWHANSA